MTHDKPENRAWESRQSAPESRSGLKGSHPTDYGSPTHDKPENGECQICGHTMITHVNATEGGLTERHLCPIHGTRTHHDPRFEEMINHGTSTHEWLHFPNLADHEPAG